MNINTVNNNITLLEKQSINKISKSDNKIQIISNSQINPKDNSSVNKLNLPQAKTKINIIEPNSSDQSYQKILYPTNNKIQNNNSENVFYINGILTKSDSAEKGATEVANLINKPVTLLYNPTEGPIKDLIESSITLAHLPIEIKIVNDTADKFYNTLKNGKDLKIVSHSQGSSIVASALTKIEKRLIHEGKNKD